jgi:hypothetical protein
LCVYVCREFCFDGGYVNAWRLVRRLLADYLLRFVLISGPEGPLARGAEVLLALAAADA